MSDQAQAVADPDIIGRLSAHLTGEPAPTKQESAPEPAPEQAAEAPVEAADEPEVEFVPEEGDEPAEAPTEVELEIEWNGEKRVLRGDELKTVAQKGFDAENKWAEAARAREWVQNQTELLKNAVQFQTAFMQDLVELKAIDSQLAQFDQVNWMQLFDSDPVSALKYKEQRDALRERRGAKYQELQGKQQQAQAGQQQSARAALEAEERALLGKIPAWRNPEKASAEKSAVRSWMASNGFTEPELASLTDHRQIVMARKAMLYDKLSKGAAEKAKLVRQAPPVTKPGSAHSDKAQATAKQAELKQKLRRTGDVKDAAALILRSMK